MKKLLGVALALMLIIAFAGCTNTPQQSADPGAQSQAPATGDESTPAPVDGEGDPVDIVVMVADDNDPSFPLTMDNPTNQLIKQVLLEKFNVNWSIEPTLGGEQYAQSVNTRLAAGTDLPDMIKFRFDPSRLMEVYESGLIIGMNELINEYAPDIKHAFEVEMPYLTIANGTADGTILRIPQVVANIQHQVTVLGIRKDFADKVSLELPETTDEFYTFLKTVQEQDVNESGTADEVFWPAYVNMNYSLGTAFGVYGAQDAFNSWWYDADKKLYNSLVTPQAKEYVTFVNKLYTEGLLAAEFTNYTGDQYNEATYANRIAATAGAWWDGVIMAGTLAQKGIDGEHVTIRNLVKNKGDASVNILKNLGGYNGFMITKDCDAPDKAMQILNYGYTLEGTRLDYNGEIYPGGDYYIAVDESKLDPRLQGKLSEGQMEYTEKGAAAMAEEPKLWNKMGFNAGNLGQYLIGTAGDIAREFYYTFTVEACGLAADIDWNLSNLQYFIDTGVANTAFVAPTTEQAAKIAEYTDLFTYIDEQVQKFMMGTRDLAEWDAFVEECNNQGLAEATAAMQERFDSYVSIMDSMGAMVFTE